MSYYLAKVNFETGEISRKGEAVVRKSEFLVAAESVIEAETKVAEYMKGTMMSFETVQIAKTRIEAVVN
jgi:hypothetical protein